MLKENLCLIKINNNISKDFLEELFLPNILNIIQLWISQEFPLHLKFSRNNFYYYLVLLISTLFQNKSCKLHRIISNTIK